MKKICNVSHELSKSLKLQESLSEIALYFISIDDFEEKINQALKLIGNSIDASRVCIFEDSEDGEFINNTYEWYNEGIGSQICTLQNISYKSIPSWRKLLIEEGKICSENINDLPEDIISFLEPQNILSIIVYPLYKNEKIKGSIGFDYCDSYHSLTISEYKFLKTISGIISGAYNKVYNENLILESRERLENVIKATNIGIWEWNINTGELIINEKYANIIGYELEELGKLNINNWNNLLEKSDLEKSKILLQQHFKGENKFYNCEMRIVHKSGKLIWIINRGKVIKWNIDGSPRTMFGTISDDTYRKRDEEERLKLTRAIEQATTTVVMMDSNAIIEYVNPAFEKSSGYSLNEVIGRDTTFLKSGLTSEDVYDQLWKTAKGGNTWEGELINRKKDGSIYYEETRITPVIDNDGKIISFLSIKQDITERKKLEEKLIESSIRDALTKIYNRRYVFERLEQISELYKRKGDKFSVTILDIDFFKNVNDIYGHPGGDFILQEFSRVLGKSIRTSDVLGRYGGEEFIIIFIDSDKDYSKTIVERILEEIRNATFKYNDKEIKFTFSAGISDASESDINNFSFEYLINEADKRLYKAKRTGRNKVVIN
jgi:diguanylate cyclase (GGDEF)-like protein/PAS domain S-box-containing protein